MERPPLGGERGRQTVQFPADAAEGGLYLPGRRHIRRDGEKTTSPRQPPAIARPGPGSPALLTVDREDGMNFIRGVYADYWCPMAERWLLACLVIADAQRSVAEPQRSGNLDGIRALARRLG